MTLQQIRFLVAIANNNFNMSAAGLRASVTQPALSRQIRLLEEELGFDLFVRNGRAFLGLTPGGERVMRHADRMLQEAQNIRAVSRDSRNARRGTLTIGTTHTQARYVLPLALQRFRAAYPDVEIHLHQGTTEQIAEMAALDRIDFAMATGSREAFRSHTLLPCYEWHRRIIVPQGHPLAQVAQPGLAQLARYPLVTYEFSFSGPDSLYQVFSQAHLRAKVALTAQDSDVLKTYVRLGLGVGIIADVALEAEDFPALVSMEAGHIFPAHRTWIGFRRVALLDGYRTEFLQMLAPHLTREVLQQVTASETQLQVDALFERVEIPVHAPTVEESIPTVRQ
jgi:LysR family cys regulon transcriptional activator